MRRERLESMTEGWFIGDFAPALRRTSRFEVAVKYYRAGDREARHFHKVATEYTVIIFGRVAMNGATFTAGDIIVINPGEATDFVVVEDTATAVVKVPSIARDKYGENA
jgi:anti-sigma factor ChrR (cupin superfamily)